ncbi:hypothetical protein OH76DRAFT_1406144 [Lentinus brumalis]|uniref:Uncharacterized protein n=1 Tax=Lentinus brumalis TaxID=2498619 RepID=A0A371D3X7_9APHY|nr:hypothetical protein OH76DRAFT_1406144 [Polyporus brumalis]
MRELIIIDPSRTQHLAPMYSWPTRVPDRCYQFYIPSWSLRRLQMQHGFDLQGSLVEDGATMIVSESQPAPSPKSRSINPVPVTFHFVNPWRDEVLTVRFGVGCECNSHFRPITPHDWWIDVHEGRQADPPGTYSGCQFVPRDHGHSPPVSKLSFRNPRCTQRHVYLDPLNDVQQHVALELGDRTVHVQTALTEYYGLRSYKNPSPITVMIDLEGFERLHFVPRKNSSGVAATTTASSNDHPHPPDNSTWLSRSWNSWGLPSIPMSIPPLTGLRSLKEWLASDVDYGYGSLV